MRCHIGRMMAICGMAGWTTASLTANLLLPLQKADIKLSDILGVVKSDSALAGISASKSKSAFVSKINGEKRNLLTDEDGEDCHYIPGIGYLNPDCSDNASDGGESTSSPEEVPEGEPTEPTEEPEPIEADEDTEKPEPTLSPEDETEGEQAEPEEDESAGPPGDGTTYFVDYRARFKRVLNEQCVGPESETLLLACQNGAIHILTAPDWIQCTPPQDSEISDGQFIYCKTTCFEEECEEYFVDWDFMEVLGDWKLSDELFVDIDYRCSGMGDVNMVDSDFWILGSEDTGESGSCSGKESDAGANFLLAELNVYCPDPGNIGNWMFVNDDYFVDCEEGVANNLNDQYMCFTGDLCRGSACAVDYTDIQISADHHQFHECIQTDDGSPVPVPEPIFESEQEEGQYGARFQLGAGVFYTEELCTDSKSGIKATCVDGIINLVESYNDKDCQVISENEIECTETPSSVVNEHVDVAIFECTSIGEGPPHVKAEYYPADIECDSTYDRSGYHYLNLGILCGDPGNEEFWSEDWFFECARDNAFVYTTDDMRFTCQSVFLVPADSEGVAFEIPSVKIETDYRWKYQTVDTCYSFKPASSSSTVSKAALVKQGMSTTVMTTKSESKSGSTSTSANNQNEPLCAPDDGVECTIGYKGSSAIAFSSVCFLFGLMLSMTLLMLE